MKNLLFGWLLKGQYQISFLDSVIFVIEAIILLYIVRLKIMILGQI